MIDRFHNPCLFNARYLANSCYLPVVAAEHPTLKDAFKDDFRVGAAIGTQQVMGDEPAALELAARQFNTITPENLLKWEEVHPQPDEYNFDPADRFVEFGEKHGMFIVGHTLVWHNQTPDWVFEGDSAKPLDREALLEADAVRTSKQSSAATKAASMAGTSSTKRSKTMALAQEQVATNHRRRLHRKGVPIRPRGRSEGRALLQRLQRVEPRENPRHQEAGSTA